jgi:hypothetical protein
MLVTLKISMKFVHHGFYNSKDSILTRKIDIILIITEDAADANVMGFVL